jgi:hypothetical protein
MTIQTESNPAYDLDALRCKVELLDDRIARQQKLIDQLRQQVASAPTVDLVSYIYSSTSQSMRFTKDVALPLLVAVAVAAWTALIALGLWGK